MKSVDLKKLSVLLIAESADRAQFMRAATNLAGVSNLQTVHVLDRAMEQLAATAFDAVFFEWLPGKAEAESFVTGIRRESGGQNSKVPLFAVLLSPMKNHVEQARDLGITDILAWPLSPATIRRKLCRAIAEPRQFIVEEAFVGPDRRAVEDISRAGPERRSLKSR